MTHRRLKAVRAVPGGVQPSDDAPVRGYTARCIGGPVDRRRALGVFAAQAGLVFGGAAASGQGPAPVRTSAAGTDLVDGRTEAATRRGLDWLAAQQDASGAFRGERNGRNAGVVALAGLAFLARGDTPGRGRYGAASRGCADYLLASASPTGFLSVRAASLHGPMYEHGFATMFLAEVYGMTTDRRVRAVLADAVRLIVTSQNAEGGWRYQSRPEDADISVTVCQMMALRAARNAGVYVPVETVERCVGYVRRSQNPDGGFMYLPTGGPSEFPRSAAGLAALYSAGIYDGPEVDRALEYLRAFRGRPDRPGAEQYFLYGHYYAVQVFWTAGGDAWPWWYAAIRDHLLDRVLADGSWSDPVGRIYGTAMALIILQMPKNYLPIFQR